MAILTFHLTYMLKTFPNPGFEVKKQGPVVQRVDNFIQRIIPYPLDKSARCPIKVKNAPILSTGWGIQYPIVNSEVQWSSSS